MTSNIVAVVQARMGSTRLPGKMLYPLGPKPVLERVLVRLNACEMLDETVVATSRQEQDELLADLARRLDTRVVRGSESDVLERMYTAVTDLTPEIIVRICADNPLLSPRCVDTVVEHARNTDADYVANNVVPTFPKGLDVEAFTFESFKRVRAASTEPRHREHVTLYYRDHPNQFSIENVIDEDVFDDPALLGRDDLRLTLDRAADYRLLNQIYREFESADVLDLAEVVSYIDENGLTEINAEVQQKQYSQIDD